MVDPISIKISPYMMEFLKRRREFSDLEPMETDESVIEFSASKKRRFTELKEEMEKVTSQSYLLNNNQYEMFQASKELILSDVEKEFNVKGNLYHYATMAEIPVIFHVNQQTSISCVLSNDPKSIPVDSLITIDCNEPTSDCKEIMHDRKEKYKLVEYESWNIAMNHHIGIYLTDKWEEEYSWIAIFNNCLKTVFKNDSVSCTIGISLPDNVAVNFKEFSKSILTVFRNSSPNHERQIYILLFVVTEFMKTKIVEALKEISNSKSDVVSFQGITSSAANNPFTVDIKEGFITEIPVDVIVSSIHPSLDLKNGRLSKAILDKAGILMQNECYRQYKYDLDFPKIAIANGYNLSAKYVFFGAIPPNEEPNENISIFIEKCLEKALDIGITSIAFPALGTGNLNYSPQKVAAEMESAIAKFQAKPQQGSLKKILIIIYPEGQKGKETLSIFKDTFAKSKDSKEAIPKRRQELSHLKYDYDHLQWVQFLNYSGKRDRLDQAVHHFEKCLLNPSEISHSHYEENSVSIESTFDSLSDATNISATQSEVKELLLFYDLPSKIKTAIKEQFDSDLLQNSVLVPRNYADEFKKYLNELRTLTYNDKLHIPSEIESSRLQHHVEKTCQQYSPIKCAISSDEKQVLFRGLTFQNIQAAKYQLELSLGLRENVLVSHDRFNTSESNAMYSSDYKSKEFQDAKPEHLSESTNVPIFNKSVVLQENVSVNNPTISVNQSEVNELLLFYCLPSQIKTTVKAQLDLNSVQNSVFLPGSYVDQFKTYLHELRTLAYNDILTIPSGIESSQLQHHVEKICQQYSPIKCAISSDEKQVLFRGLTFENIQAAKYQLELFLGLQENVSVNNPTISVNQSEVNELLLFYGLPSQIKTTVKAQLDLNSVQNSIFLPGSYVDQFKTYLNELRTLAYNDILTIPSGIESSQLQHHVEKICQQYSPIKYAISSDEKQVLFRGLTFQNIQAAKYQLELFLGLQENVSVSQDLFNISESNSMSSSDYKSKEFQDVQDDSITYEKPEDRAVSTNVQIHHKPVFKSSYEPVPSGHRPRFRSAFSLEPSYDKTEESSNKLSNISHQPVFKSSYEPVPKYRSESLPVTKKKQKNRREQQ